MLSPRQIKSCRLKQPRALPVLVFFFGSPHSYTGQDMAELQCPGNPALLDRLMLSAVEQGARPAEAGEFTFRAFLAGKLDLTQAEGVAATIAATSDAQLQAAAHLRRGALGSFSNSLVDALADQLALVEAGIDFTDQEDVIPIAPRDLNHKLQALAARLDHLLRHSRPWSAVDALPRVVLAGPPSAGKSTLFNALLGRRRAVVSESPGTTRDILSEPLRLEVVPGDGIEVMLQDIAGLDTPRRALDRAAQQAACQALEQADLLLMVDDRRDHDWSLPISLPNKPTIHLRTKVDLSDEVALADERSGGSPADSEIFVSALTGEGLDELRERIAARLADRAVGLSEQMLVLTPRHELSIRRAYQAITEALAFTDVQRSQRVLTSPELVAAALRDALDQLAALGGRMTPDDVIGRVFAHFCVGK